MSHIILSCIINWFYEYLEDKFNSMSKLTKLFKFSLTLFGVFLNISMLSPGGEGYKI